MVLSSIPALGGYPTWNHAHTVPPVAVPYTSPENAPVGETGWQPAAPKAPIVGTAVGEKWAAVGEDTPAELLSEGVQAHARASANSVATAPRDIRVRTIFIASIPRGPRGGSTDLQLVKPDRAPLTI